VQVQPGGHATAGEGRSSGEQAASSSSRLMPSSFGGYLANISPSEYRELYKSELPVSLLGADFLRTYGPHLDSATAVDPHTEYAVRDPAAHPVHENHRRVGVLVGGGGPDH
jgi:L-arabinokinase